MPEGDAQPPPMLDAAVAFGRVLRGAGLRVGTDRVVEFARALEELDASRREDVYWAGRITLVSRPEELEIYDRAFELFWEQGSEREAEATPEGPALHPAARPLRHAAEEDGREERDGARRPSRLRYSPVEVLRHKGLRPVLRRGVRRACRPAGRPAASPGRSRRAGAWSPLRRGRHDPRRTLRGAMRTGGEAVRHRFRKARVSPRRVVLLCDVSGSMAPYSRALLRFLHASVVSGGASRGVLRRNSAHQDHHASSRPATRTGRSATGLGRGTRTSRAERGSGTPSRSSWTAGGSAAWRAGPSSSSSPTAGTGETWRCSPSRCSASQRLAYRVVWVNPLKAAPGYKPLAAGHGRRAPARGRVPLGPQLRVPRRARPRRRRRNRAER